MTCYYPLDGFYGYNVKTGKHKVVFKPDQVVDHEPIQVPCGRCIGCRIDYSKQWAVRISCEAQLYGLNNSFVTLTYKTEPYDGSLVKAHLQNFMKRLRNRYPQPIRFYGCGEYGDKNERPHYHICLFNIDFRSDRYEWSKNRDGLSLYRSPSLEETWQAATTDGHWQPGHAIIGELNYESAAYVARYCLKKVTGPKAQEHYLRSCPLTAQIYEIEPEFSLMSRQPGIGYEWLKKYHTDVYPEDFVVIPGMKRSKPPRYFDLKIEDFDGIQEDIIQRIKDERNRFAEDHMADNTPERLDARHRFKLLQFDKFHQRQGIDK